MLKVGLTGGIGCGKTTVTQRFQEHGVPVIDADRLAREVVAPGQPALAEVRAVFGGQALLSDGNLNRAWLRQTVFADPERLQQLEAILHPRIRAEILRRIEEHEGHCAYILVDVPLLLEKNYRGLFDRILVVDCLPGQQLQRVRQRDGSEESVVEAIMQTQVTRDARLQMADDILENMSTLTALYQKIDNIHIKYLMLSGT